MKKLAYLSFGLLLPFFATAQTQSVDCLNPLPGAACNPFDQGENPSVDPNNQPENGNGT